MKNLKYIFPNALTLVNLILGCAAITVTFIDEYEYFAAWLIMLAAVFDVFDGWVAKALDARSEFGVQLDSLADMVSFGVAPSIILFKLFWMTLINMSVFSTFELISLSLPQGAILFCSFLFAAAVAVRLARFNLITEKSTVFSGLPSTAAALIVSSIWLILGNTESGIISSIILNIYVVFALLILLIFLMLSNLKMLSLKFEGAMFHKNRFQYLVLGGALFLIVLFGTEGIFLALMYYLLLSLAGNIISFDKK